MSNNELTKIGDLVKLMLASHGKDCTGCPLNKSCIIEVIKNYASGNPENMEKLVEILNNPDTLNVMKSIADTMVITSEDKKETDTKILFSSIIVGYIIGVTGKLPEIEENENLQKAASAERSLHEMSINLKSIIRQALSKEEKP